MMKNYFKEVEPSVDAVNFGCDSTHVYMVVVDGITFGPFKYAEGAGIPSHATPANDPSSVFVGCEHDKITVHFSNPGAYAHVELLEFEDFTEVIGGVTSLLADIKVSLAEANSKLADIVTNTGRIQ
jgi:hypothetical protein